MTGTLINIAAILLGSLAGIFFGTRLPERLKETVVNGMGLFTAAIGLQMFFKTSNALIVLGALILGALLGEWWRIEDGIARLGEWLEKRFSGTSAGSSSRFVRGFLAASLLYCTGPMAILGSIQDGLTGNYQTLAIKSVLDGFISIAFASTLGIGVLFSIFPVGIYQGSISLLAGMLQSLLTEAMITEMTATGGVILFGLGLSSLLEIKKIRVGNFLPALAIAPLIVWLLAR
ncbi:MAG: DUF554 domain-containing protein [Anaerolineae bacterium CG_4_9_14_3_um_filter_57_17]|nr:DUF554 domain-containing protein [bacterium]NCT21398.1 DUF554 domain-containing protein [bacterium]OIO83187.1 MAG: hypothetical protein AUK01_13485 [Anaerolineae bacterium CG2_30_57_67]PJB67409.1 MAG: DUF554 domain-containing protein [Anaerolineae bacterium CG_4_9_14_3_um_filter_57_17]